MPIRTVMPSFLLHINVIGKLITNNLTECLGKAKEQKVTQSWSVTKANVSL